jgi:hypothetical protein
MSSCFNDVSLARYIILFSNPKELVPFPITDVISVSGLSLGDQGTVTLTQQDRIVELPDGIRKLPTLNFTCRFKNGDIQSEFVKAKLFEWYNERSTKTYDIQIFITNKTFCPQHSYKYLGSSIKNISENDKEMGKPDFSIITISTLPYDVIYLSMVDTVREISGTMGSRIGTLAATVASRF